ncbi:MAG: ferrous iron transporter B, partial [Alphaproteobacteria bacterium]|nr:ferrous iron transporter B [Alphaproteobacteria bacterium]
MSTETPHVEAGTAAARTIAMVGNPNAGKTTVFNALTGSRQRVGNWPGVTVERKIGHYRHDGEAWTVVDLPGSYALGAAETSLDEKLARDYVASGEAELVVNIVDAANLERNLYMTTQLREMGAPVVVALNMLDVARERGIRIDPEALERRLGCPVVSLVASRGEGIDRLKSEIARTAAEPARAVPEPVRYRPEIEEAIAAVTKALDEAAPGLPYSHRWVAVQLLEGDPDLAARVGPEIAGKAREAAAAIEEAGDEDIDILLADGRYAFIHALTGDVVKRAGRLPRTVSDRIDRVVLHRALGIPIFFALMYLMFMWTINV